MNTLTNQFSHGDGEVTKVENEGGRCKVAFLYNHDAGHQVRHSAAVIPELVNRHSDVEVTVVSTSTALMNTVFEICGAAVLSQCKIVNLTLPSWHKLLAKAADKFSPFSRFDHLFANRKMFQEFDALVVTEGTSLFLKRFNALRHLKFIRIDHGGGDRSIGFHPSFGGNDLVLLPGNKQKDRYLKLGYLREKQIAVVGYPKFESTKTSIIERKIFSNGRPTVLYNPHPEPYLSSWYKMGNDVLEYFYSSDKYNLIFAPHVMLFLRRFHISSERLSIKYRRDLPEKYYNCPHILIDIGSPASMDMTYTMAADIYVGDASSQIYEFLSKPRPCILLDSHKPDWQNDPNYAFWHFGPVISSIEELDKSLDQAAEAHKKCQGVQEAGFSYTFDQAEASPSVRAADAIANFLKETPNT